MLGLICRHRMHVQDTVNDFMQHGANNVAMNIMFHVIVIFHFSVEVRLKLF